MEKICDLWGGKEAPHDRPSAIVFDEDRMNLEELGMISRMNARVVYGLGSEGAQAAEHESLKVRAGDAQLVGTSRLTTAKQIAECLEVTANGGVTVARMFCIEEQTAHAFLMDALDDAGLYGGVQPSILLNSMQKKGFPIGIVRLDGGDAIRTWSISSADAMAA